MSTNNNSSVPHSDTLKYRYHGKAQELRCKRDLVCELFHWAQPIHDTYIKHLKLSIMADWSERDEPLDNLMADWNLQIHQLAKSGDPMTAMQMETLCDLGIEAHQALYTCTLFQLRTDADLMPSEATYADDDFYSRGQRAIFRANRYKISGERLAPDWAYRTDIGEEVPIRGGVIAVDPALPADPASADDPARQVWKGDVLWKAFADFHARGWMVWKRDDNGRIAKEVGESARMGATSHITDAGLPFVRQWLDANNDWADFDDEVK